MPKPEELANCPRCQHIKDDGIRCAAPALRGKKLCHNHERQRRTFPHRPYRKTEFCRRADFFNVRTPDDVMRALNKVINSLLGGQMSEKEANSIIFALQTATLFAPHTSEAKRMPNISVPQVSTAKRSNVRISHPSPLACPGDLPELPPNWRPKSVAEIFDTLPGLDDIRAMLTPEDIAQLEGRSG